MEEKQGCISFPSLRPLFAVYNAIASFALWGLNAPQCPTTDLGVPRRAVLKAPGMQVALAGHRSDRAPDRKPGRAFLSARPSSRC